LIVDQEPAFSREVRQIVEAMVRGRYAFTNSATKAVLREFLDAGLGKNVQLVDLPHMSYLTNANALWIVNRRPHPNGAQLLANWALTRAGQESFSKNVEVNSRRADLPPFDEVSVPKQGQDYLRVGPEDSLKALDRTEQLLDEWPGLQN